MISQTEARNLITKKSIAKFKEKKPVYNFFTSFFKKDESKTKHVSIEVRRNARKVAVDVLRGTDGNLNKFSKSTEKMFLPPLYWEWMRANDHDLYDVAIAQLNPTNLANLAEGLADDMMELRNKIEEAIELQCAQVFLDGVIQLKKNTNIDFKRKAASIVDSGGTEYWTGSAFDPRKTIEKAGEFIHREGKVAPGELTVICGKNAYAALEDSTFIKEKADLKDYAITNIAMPQQQAVGATLQGRMSAGQYKANLFVYSGWYLDANGVQQDYMDPDSIIVLPAETNFKLAFAAVPQLIKGSTAPQKGAYLVSDYLDEREVAHEMHIKSAPVAIPVAVDTIFTEKVA